MTGFLLFIASFCPQLSSAQSKLDSLQAVYDSADNRLTKYDAKMNIANFYFSIDSFDLALKEYGLAAQIAPEKDCKMKGKAIEQIAEVHHAIEDPHQAIKYFKLAYDFYEKTDCDPEIIANTQKEIGREFYGGGQYDSAMVYYMKSKALYEENNIQNEHYGSLLHYIGSVFKRQGDYDKACEYYQMEIDYGKQHNFPEIFAEGFYLSALCVEEDTAHLRHEIQAMRIYEELGSDRMTALMQGNVALSYEDLGMYDSAYYYMMKSLEYRRKDSGKSHLASLLSSIGGLLIKMKRYDEAQVYLAEAESVAQQSGLKRSIRLMHIYDELYKVNYILGNYESAIEFLHLRYTYRDSARDADHQSAIHEMELAYETEKKEAEIVLLEADRNMKAKEKELAEEDAANQAFTKNLYLGGGLLVLFLGGFIFFKLKESQHQKKIITEQKREVEFQKELIEAKNKDIMDSMIYASKIQQAIITSEEYISQMFPEFFILYKPRDIVSGDFYWAYQTEDRKKLIAVGDCTGHGVPGAMMSMLGTAFLNEIVVEGKETNPGLVLDKLRSQVKKAMKSKEARDGMDMSICFIEDEKMTFSGANLPVYIIRNGELIEIKGDKQPIGYHPSAETPFENKEIILEKEDQVYLFSDGYADQFGGEKGKKYKYKTFRDKLAKIWVNPMNEQCDLINLEFETWKGDLEQLDDVCVIGVRI